MKGTANVVVRDGTPWYVSNDLGMAQDVAREMDEVYDDDVELWENVAYNITPTDEEGNGE